MANPRIPVNIPICSIEPMMEEVVRRVTTVIESGWWLRGSEVAAFEDAFSQFCGVSHCLAVANGTDGLELALRAAAAEGSEVITVANAGGYTTTACRLVGATPVYVDVTPDRLVIDPDAAIAAVTDRTRAIVATHLYGSVADTETIRSGLKRIGREDVVLIEDASQAHGATMNGRRVGGFGDLSVFSFYPTKNLTMNWRGRPLTSIRTIVELISATTTNTGLTIQADYDPNWYPKGVKITDRRLAAVPLTRHDWHGDWNYTIHPA